MKKRKLLVFILFFLIVPITIRADINSSTKGTGYDCNNTDSCWIDLANSISGQTRALYSVRLTLFNEKAERVSDSVDIALNTIPKDLGVKRNNNSPSKIEYIKGTSLNWYEGNLDNIITLPSDIVDYIAKNSNALGQETNDTFQNVAAKYFQTHGVKSVENIYNKLQYCKGIYEKKCNDDYKYYAVFEPTTLVVMGTTKYYGTAYELASKLYSARYISSVVRSELPNALYITGEYPDFYSTAGIWSRDGNYNIHKTDNYTQEEILKFGVGIGVFNWTYPGDRPEIRKNISCDVNVNIEECGESGIHEASNNNKECIVGNAAYLYMDGCNLYCSDTITTDFNGFYGTFIGNNALKAIKSGKYMAIKSNPKITISKTCHQSDTSNECPDVSGSFRNKLNSDYRTNKIYLNIDGKKYDFIGNSTITNNGYSSATITYEYKLDENVNKYIDIKTMKGVLTPSNITYTNNGPMIITSKGYYGTYTYNFDVSDTPLNKYTSSSSSLRKIKNEQSGKYNFQNKININYSNEKDNKKTNYTNEDLKNTTCSYFKYNTETSCIGEKDKCVDSVTCEVLNECPPNPNGENCTCTGEYGCLDDGKCTPITNPTKDDGKKGNETCDPETKTCFPNLIYRPISLIEPFPGKDGNERTPGNNWNKIVKTADGRVYSYGDYYIRLRRGYKDYEIYQTEPLYVIKLDGNKIQAIRKYNDKHDYNDFELTCINGENCVSNFLRGATQDFSINLIDSGTCKNINSHNFDSCIKNKGE